jgi:hypothetical protein
MLLYPFGQFAAFVHARVSFVRQQHETVIGLATQRSAQALCSVSHRIKCEKILLGNAKLVT